MHSTVIRWLAEIEISPVNAWNLVMYLLRSMHYIAATLDRKRCWNRFSSLLNCPCYFTVHGTTAPPLRAATPRRHRRSLHFLSKAVGLREGGVGVCPDKSGRAFPWHPWPKPCKGATCAAATPQPRCVVALFESVCRFVL